MTRGLAAFLERIRSQPENEVLLDRFLLLVAEMEDCEEKANLLLEFVSTIRREHPKFALQILRQVYRQVHCSWVRHPQELAMQTLQVLHDTMLSMRRDARAGLIANEMQRLRENPLKGAADRVEQAHSFQESLSEEKVHSTDIFSSDTMQDEARINPFVMPTELEAKETVSPQNPPAASPTPEIDNLTFKDMRKIFRMFDAYMKEEPVLVAQEPVIAPVEVPVSSELVIAPAEIPVSNEYVIPPVDVPEIPAIPVLEIPEVPVVKEVPLLERLFGAAMYAEENNDSILPRLLQLSESSDWKLTQKDVQRLAAQLRETENPLWLASLWFAIGREHLCQLFEESASADELMETWHACMTFMLERQMYRRALIFMRMSLNETMHPNTAVSAYQYLTTVWKGLRLHGFAWQPEEGAHVLAAKLSLREEPLYQGLIVA